MASLTVLGVFFLITFVNCHVFKMGSCPKVEAVESFDYDKFMGTWFVIEKFDTSSSCMKYEFGKYTDGKMFVREMSHPMSVSTFGTFSQTGEVTMTPGESQGKMMIQYPVSINPFSPAEHYVMMTDYETYAGLWSCRKVLFTSYMSGMIMSRTRTLDRAIINKIRTRFEYYGINKADLSVVDQEQCAKNENPTSRSGLPDAGLRIPAIITHMYNNETEIVVTLKPNKQKPTNRIPNNSNSP